MKFILMFMSLFNSYKVIWDNTEFHIPLYEDVSEYFDIPTASLYKDGRIIETPMYIVKGVNDTPLTVVNSNHVKTFRVYYEVNFFEIGIKQKTEVFFNIIDNKPPEFIYVPDIMMSVGDKLISEKSILENIVYEDNYYSNDKLVLSIKNLNIVNVNIPGSYDLIYEIRDPSNNINTYIGKYIITNNIPPKVTYKNPIKIEYGTKLKYYEHFIVTDDNDQSIDIFFDDSNVNYNKLGTYFIYLKATNSAGLSTSVKTTVTIVDTKKPNIILKDNFVVSVNDEKFNLRDIIVSVEDNYDDLEISDVKILGYFDVSIIGSYKIIYEISDSSGNQFEKSTTINVKDINKPTIQVIKDLLINVKEEVLISDYFYIHDNYDHYSDLKISYDESRIDFNKIGIYNLIITVKDSSNNTLIENFNVEVRDLEPPLVSLRKDIIIFDFFDLDEEYIKTFFTITDNYDDEKDIKLIMLSEIVNKLGTQEVELMFKDTSNNKTFIVVEIVINDNLGPLITLVSDSIEFKIGSKIPNYNNYLFSVKDNYTLNEDIEIEIKDNLVNYNEYGMYYVVYKAYDDFNNVGYKILKIYVIDENEKSLIEGNEVKLKVGDIYEPYKNIYFNTSVVHKEHSEIMFNTDQEGLFEVIYYARDNKGNEEYYIQKITIEKNNEIVDFLLENKLHIISSIIVGISSFIYYIKKRKNTNSF